MNEQFNDKANYWRVPEYDGMEMLHARYINHRFPLHFHEEYVVSVVERGYHQFWYHGKRHTMSQGDIVLINPGEVHGCYDDEKGWQYRCFYPSVSMMQELAEEISDENWQAPEFVNLIVNDARLANRLLTLHQAMEHSKTRLVKDTLLREAMGLLIRKHAVNQSGDSQSLSDNRAIANATDYLQAHYADDVSLDDIAGEVGLSPYHLSRVFKQQTGLPPHKYLIQVRVHRAKDLLNAGMPIADVALEVGFADQSHLTKWFKRVVGVPPGQFTG